MLSLLVATSGTDPQMIGGDKEALGRGTHDFLLKGQSRLIRKAPSRYRVR